MILIDLEEQDKHQRLAGEDADAASTARICIRERIQKTHGLEEKLLGFDHRTRLNGLTIRALEIVEGSFGVKTSRIVVREPFVLLIQAIGKEALKGMPGCLVKDLA